MLDGTDSSEPRTAWRPKFQLATLFLVTLVFCVMGTAGYHLIHARPFVRIAGQSISPNAAFILFTLASPLLLLVVLSVVRTVVEFVQRARNRDG